MTINDVINDGGRRRQGTHIPVQSPYYIPGTRYEYKVVRVIHYLSSGKSPTKLNIPGNFINFGSGYTEIYAEHTLYSN